MFFDQNDELDGLSPIARNDIDTSHITKQLEFLREIDRLKVVSRQSTILDKSRRENSAEHSWHLAMFAWSLADSAEGQVNVERVIRMLLLHDIVEIDAGDTPFHSGVSMDVQSAKEAIAAQRLFGLMPEPQSNEMLDLWHEFEKGESADARFAKALDRFQPLLTNIHTGGGTWSENQVTHAEVLNRYGPVIKKGAPKLWTIAEQMVNQHFAKK